MTGALRFSADAADIDRALVHRWLSEESYWAAGRPRSVQEAAMDGSRNYAVLDGGTQVGFARAVTDGATFAWLCDVFVVPEARGRGAGKLLVEGVMDDLRALGIGRVVLKTADAHGLYARHGFAPPADPERWLELRPA